MEAVDARGQCIIHYAVRNSSINILEHLHCHHNSYFKTLLLKRDSQNRTSLQLAAEQC